MTDDVPSDPTPTTTHNATSAATESTIARPYFLLIGALIIGFLIDMLTYGRPVGVGYALAALIIVGGGLILGYGCGVRPSRAASILMAFLALIGLMIALRASPTMRALNALTGLGLVLLIAAVYVPGHLARLSLSGYALEVSHSSVAALVQPFLHLLIDLPKSRKATGKSPRLLPVFWGLLLAIPLLIVFGAFFYRADAVFAGYVRQLFANISLFEVTTARFIWGLVLSWLALGLIRHAITRQRDTADSLSSARPQGLRLGSSEAMVVLTLLNALFIVFVVIQAVYLFGGTDTLDRTGLTYSEYARRGFFELVVVAGMVLSFILPLNWLVRPVRQRVLTVVNSLHILLIALTLVILGSAWQRMLLYRREYGLTELRFYTTAFMGWLALVLTWLIFTVLIQKTLEANDLGRRQFAFGALIAALALLAGLNLLNPDAFIARTNLARAQASSGPRLDTEYLTRTLSADAVPALLAGMERLSDHCLRADLARGLQDEANDIRREVQAHGWLGTTWGDTRARRSLSAAVATLDSYQQGCPE